MDITVKPRFLLGAANVEVSPWTLYTLEKGHEGFLRLIFKVAETVPALKTRDFLQKAFQFLPEDPKEITIAYYRFGVWMFEAPKGVLNAPGEYVYKKEQLQSLQEALKNRKFRYKKRYFDAAITGRFGEFLLHHGPEEISTTLLHLLRESEGARAIA